MSFVSTAIRAARLATEYTGALNAALRAAEEQKPLAEVVRAFAESTEDTLDDQAVEILVTGINEAISWAQRIGHWAYLAASFVEDTGPRAADSAARAGVVLVKLVQRLERLR